MRRVLIVALAITAMSSCNTTNGCGCTPVIPSTTVRGDVQKVDSTPAVGAVSWSIIYHDTTCALPAQRGVTTTVDGSARFLHDVPRYGHRACVAVYAAAGWASNDSVGVTRIHTFDYYLPPDTLLMPVIRLP